MNILLLGYYGYANVGDEALLEVISSNLKRDFPLASLTALSANPALTQDYYQINALPRFTFKSIRQAINDCDVMIIGGGSILQDITSIKSILYYLTLIGWAKFKKKKVVLYGQGVGPVIHRRSQWLMRRILKKVDLIILRDQKSFDLLRSIGVKNNRLHVHADPSFLLNIPSKQESQQVFGVESIRQKNKPILGVSIRAVNHNQENTYISIAAAIDYMAKQNNYQIVFVPFQSPQDVEAASKVIKHMKEPSTLIFRILSPKEALALLSQFDLFVGMRLHSLIFSTLVNVPFLGVSYDPKVEVFLEQMQLPVFDCNSVSSEKLIEQLEWMHENKIKIKESLIRKCSQLKNEAFKGHNKLNRFIGLQKVIEVLGISVDKLSLKDAVDAINLKIKQGLKKQLVFTPNPEIIIQAQKDESLKEIINQADINIPDGIGLVLASRIIGSPLKERVTGIDLMQALLKLANQNKYRIYLLGSKPGINERAVHQIRQKYPSLEICGAHSGYFNDATDIIKEIAIKAPQLLFVGLGSPKQEKWLFSNLDKLDFNLAMVIGGSLDVISGTKKRAPKGIRKIGFEWLYRLVQEPTRIKRQLSLIKFMFNVIKKRLDKHR